MFNALDETGAGDRIGLMLFACGGQEKGTPLFVSMAFFHGCRVAKSSRERVVKVFASPPSKTAGANAQICGSGYGINDSKGIEMRKRILIVDDQPDLRRLVRLSLELGGYDVYEAENGDECLARLVDIRPDLILLDVMMPGTYDGYETCQQIKQRLPSLPVVMLSARAQQGDMDVGGMVGADGYITKPFSPLALTKKITGFLG